MVQLRHVRLERYRPTICCIAMCLAKCDGGGISLLTLRGKFVKWRERPRELVRVAKCNNLINCTKIVMIGGGQLH